MYHITLTRSLGVGRRRQRRQHPLQLDWLMPATHCPLTLPTNLNFLFSVRMSCVIERSRIYRYIMRQFTLIFFLFIFSKLGTEKNSIKKTTNFPIGL